MRDYKKMRFRKVLPLGLLIVPALAGGWILHDMVPDNGQQMFSQVVSLVRSNALKPMTDDEIFRTAARGLVDELGDAYAELYSPEELAAFNREGLGNAYGGLGMLIESQEGVITVTKVCPRTPAERGGVMAGDRIVRVGTTPTQGLKIDSVSHMLLGVIGTQVDVAFQRAGTPALIQGTYTRASVQRPAVPLAVVIDKDIGYIKLERFSENSANEVRNALLKLRAGGAKSFVLDVRGNGGGSVPEAEAISNLFLDPGQEIFSIRYRNRPTDVSLATRPAVSKTEPVVVLIDPYTASASEIVTGALQDHDRALVVGTTSFGKGLVQEIYRLQDQWAMKMTIGKWYTPAGRGIHLDRDLNGVAIDSAKNAKRPEVKSDGGRIVYGGGGIVPDVKVEPDTMTTVEQQFVRALGPKANAVYVGVYDEALAVKNTVKPGFKVEPAWRNAVFAHLQKSGAVAPSPCPRPLSGCSTVTRAEFDGAQSLIDRLLELRIANLAFGDEEAFTMTIQDDAPVRSAIALLRKGHTQKELFALAGTGRSGL
jgi:carboxyl-terminal processing protease